MRTIRFWLIHNVLDQVLHGGEVEEELQVDLGADHHGEHDVVVEVGVVQQGCHDRDGFLLKLNLIQAGRLQLGVPVLQVHEEVVVDLNPTVLSFESFLEFLLDQLSTILHLHHCISSQLGFLKKPLRLLNLLSHSLLFFLFLFGFEESQSFLNCHSSSQKFLQLLKLLKQGLHSFCKT